MHMKRLVYLGAVLLILCVTVPVWAALSSEEELGRKLYFDMSLSLKGNQSCATCHDPAAGFTDPKKQAVSQGSVAGKFGGRDAPSAAYAAFSPFFHWDGALGLYVGGQFWDGRANTLADQAGGPPLNPVEMAMPDKMAIISLLAVNPAYKTLFSKAYNFNLSSAVVTPQGVDAAYALMTKAIGAFEKTSTFNSFNSKFDYFQQGMANLTAQELNGLNLFNGIARCSGCHLSLSATAPDGVSQIPPLFTDFTYDNLGLPKNINIPDYKADPTKVDKGIGGRQDVAAKDPMGLQVGKFKVATLRNIALTSPYGHNGVFKTLAQIVHFYNTRDVIGAVCTDNNDPRFGTACWPAPEVIQNLNNRELGNLGLTAAQEADIVAFLNTLTDNYVDPITGLPPGVLTPVVFPPMP
jgi:cytochrome c peroxidase